MVDVALFPIPNSVNFPWVPCQLHVFEPRYRQMVKHCIEEKLLMGVCQTEKLVHEHEREQTVEGVLSSNLSTYKPTDIFSAGPVQLLQEIDDGRLLIQVDIEQRLRLGKEKQTLPFSIWSCEEVLDQLRDSEQETTLAQSQAKILRRLLNITHNDQQSQKTLNSDHWQAMPAHKFSFAIAAVLGIAPDTSQALLEMTNAQERLDTILDMLNAIGPDIGSPTGNH